MKKWMVRVWSGMLPQLCLVSRCCETFAPAVGLLRVGSDLLAVPTAAPARPVRDAMALCVHTMSSQSYLFLQAEATLGNL